MQSGKRGYAMKTAKKLVSFRLSLTTTKELADLAKRYKVSQADVISVLVHNLYIGGDMDSLDEWFDIATLG
jgi:indole-3-glycerol phosphate synthase